MSTLFFTVLVAGLPEPLVFLRRASKDRSALEEIQHLLEGAYVGVFDLAEHAINNRENAIKTLSANSADSLTASSEELRSALTNLSPRLGSWRTKTRSSLPSRTVDLRDHVRSDPSEAVQHLLEWKATSNVDTPSSATERLLEWKAAAETPYNTSDTIAEVDPQEKPNGLISSASLTVPDLPFPRTVQHLVTESLAVESPDLYVSSSLGGEVTLTNDGPSETVEGQAAGASFIPPFYPYKDPYEELARKSKPKDEKVKNLVVVKLLDKVSKSPIVIAKSEKTASDLAVYNLLISDPLLADVKVKASFLGGLIPDVPTTQYPPEKKEKGDASSSEEKKASTYKDGGGGTEHDGHHEEGHEEGYDDEYTDEEYDEALEKYGANFEGLDGGDYDAIHYELVSEQDNNTQHQDDEKHAATDQDNNTQHQDDKKHAATDHETDSGHGETPDSEGGPSYTEHNGTHEKDVDEVGDEKAYLFDEQLATEDLFMYPIENADAITDMEADKIPHRPLRLTLDSMASLSDAVTQFFPELEPRVTQPPTSPFEPLYVSYALPVTRLQAKPSPNVPTNDNIIEPFTDDLSTFIGLYSEAEPKVAQSAMRLFLLSRFKPSDSLELILLEYFNAATSDQTLKAVLEVLKMPRSASTLESLPHVASLVSALHDMEVLRRAMMGEDLSLIELAGVVQKMSPDLTNE